MTAAHAAVYFTDASGLRPITAAFEHDFNQTISQEPLYWLALPQYITTLRGVDDWLRRGPNKYALHTRNHKNHRMIYYVFVSPNKVLITWIP